MFGCSDIFRFSPARIWTWRCQSFGKVEFHHNDSIVNLARRLEPCAQVGTARGVHARIGSCRSLAFPFNSPTQGLKKIAINRETGPFQRYRRKADIETEALPNFALDTGDIWIVDGQREGLAAVGWMSVGALLALFWHCVPIGAATKARCFRWAIIRGQDPI